VILVHTAAYLIGRGVAVALAATIVGIVGLASLPGRFLLNLLSDRLGPQPLLGLCLVAQAIGVVLLLHGASPGWLIAFIIAYGGAFGAISPLRAAVVASHFGRRAFGSITALQGVPVVIAAGAGPLLAGALYVHLGGYTPPFGLCAGAFLLAALCVAATLRPAAV
jgi:MFS family permease